MKISGSRSSEGTLEIGQPQSSWKTIRKKSRPERTMEFESFRCPCGTQKNLWVTFQPLCGWLISRRRFATQLAVATTILLFAVGTMAETTNTLSDAEIQGRQLAQQLCEASMENATNTGVLKIRNAKGMTTTVPVKFETIVTKTNWLNIYEISNSTYKSGKFFKLMVTHIGVSNEYLASFPMVNADVSWGTLNCYTQIVTIPIQSDAKTMVPFANSDFWLCDLGLEFFHWPAQKVLKKEVKRSRGCTVLESTNPDPATNGYSRVVSWIDGESGGIVQAQAYDANNKLLKEFYPKDFKKVKGQWQVERLDIDNVQTGSHTRLEFDLKAP